MKITCLWPNARDRKRLLARCRPGSASGRNHPVSSRKRVAQAGSLLSRRLAVGRPRSCPSACGLAIRDTADYQSAPRRSHQDAAPRPAKSRVTTLSSPDEPCPRLRNPQFQVARLARLRSESARERRGARGAAHHRSRPATGWPAGGLERPSDWCSPDNAGQPPGARNLFTGSLTVK